MTIPTFIQNSRINQVIFQIRHGSLHVSARWIGGRFTDYVVDLRTLDPDYQPRFTRSYALLGVPLVTMLLCGVAIWGLLHQTLVPQEAAAHFYSWPIFGFAGSLIAAIRGSRRIEYYQFNNHWGKSALVIVREPQQADECAAFIATLVAHIELAQSNLPKEERAKLLARFELDSANPVVQAPAPDLWKASVALGALASLLPWVPNINYYFLDFLFPIIFTLCLGGAALCVFSFLNNEPRRWFSALGLALSLIPPFFS
jgi:hypothetical protein